jgi:4-amino-4-deoxy-L-arabinose transferase-like glycosyltransferase
MTGWRNRTPGQNREWLSVGAVLAAGFALRIYFLLLPVARDDDTAVYAELARNWFQHGVYGFLKNNRIDPTLIRLPGYPIFLGVVFSVFGQDHLRTAMVIQALVDLLGCWLVFDCLRQGVSRRAAWAGLLLAAFCPFTAAYTAAGMTESLSIFCVALSIWSAARTVRAARARETAWGPLLGLGAALGYATLLRPDGVLLTVAFSAGIIWSARRPLGWTRAMRLGVAVGVLATLPLVPWAIRNYETFHVVQPLAPRYANNPGEFVPSGFFRWMRTWSLNFVDAGTVFWNLDDQIDMDDLPARTCYTTAECRQTEALITEHDTIDTVTPALDAKFAALAAQRVRERPWNYYVVFPVLRVTNMWLWPRTELFAMNIYWWRVREHPQQSAIAIGLGLLNLGYIVLAAVGFARRRVPMKAALLGYIALRCLLLAQMENPEQRYTMVAFPILFVAAACTLAGRVASDEEAVTTPGPPALWAGS